MVSQMPVSNPVLPPKKAFSPIEGIDELDEGWKRLALTLQGTIERVLQGEEKSFDEIHPQVDEGVLRIWGLRYFEVGGVRVIGWQ